MYEEAAGRETLMYDIRTLSYWFLENYFYDIKNWWHDIVNTYYFVIGERSPIIKAFSLFPLVIQNKIPWNIFHSQY